MPPQSNHEARIKALEEILYGNPGALTKSDGVTLKEYLETRLVAMDKATESARMAQQEYFEMKFAALQRAVDKAAEEEKAKFLTVNEFRGTLTDYTTTLATTKDLEAAKDKLDVQINSVISRIGALERSESKAEGKASQGSVYIGYIFTAIGTGLAIASIIMN